MDTNRLPTPLTEGNTNICDVGDKTEDVGGKTEDVGDKTEVSSDVCDVGDKTEDVGGKTEDVGDKTEVSSDVCDVGDKTEVNSDVCDIGDKTEDVGGRTEDVGDKTEATSDACDLGDNAIPQPANKQVPSKSEPLSPDVAAHDANPGASKRPRESSAEENNERPRQIPFPIFREEFEYARRLVVNPGNIETTFADIHTRPSTIEAFENAILPIRHPAAFSYGVLSRCSPPSILLYGPPGTGKTLLVRAFAKQANSNILAISGADINDKYVGIGEKKIKSIFTLARLIYPCIIFIDEADALFKSRSSRSFGYNLQYLNEFLAEMDGIGSRGLKDPIVVAATNRPFDMDEGILRRLGKRILVDVPDVAAREEILKIHMRGETLADDVNFSELAKATPDYTGADLKNLVYAAAVRALREEMTQKPPSPPTSGATDPTGSQIGSHRVLHRSHFLFAKRTTPPAPISDTASKIREFHNKYGDTVQRHNGQDSRNKVKSAVNL